MLAGSSTQKTGKGQESLLEAAKALLVVIKINEQATSENYPEWITGLENFVNTTDVLAFVLGADGNVQVPPDQVYKVQADRSVQQALKRIVVKTEVDEGGAEKKLEKQKESEGDADLFLQAAKFAAARKAKAPKQTGEKHAVYFVDTDCVFDGEQAAKLASRHVLIEVELPEGTYWCPVETQAKRDNRFFVWRIIETTLVNIEKRLWEHIPLGNIFLLVQFVKNMCGKERAEQQSNKWHSNLENLRLDKKKGFDFFIAEVNKILVDAKILEIHYDQTNVRNKVRDAIVRGGGEVLNDQWVRAIVAEAKQLRKKPDTPKWSIPKILDEMRPGVLATQSTQRSLATVGGRVVDGSRDLQKENEELKKLIKKFQSSVNQGFQSSVNQGDNPGWWGVCGDFQEGACTRPNCRYKHTVLGPEDKLKLQEHRSKKAAENAQGGGGRKWKGQAGGRKANIKKTLVDWAKRDDWADIRAEVLQQEQELKEKRME